MKEERQLLHTVTLRSFFFSSLRKLKSSKTGNCGFNTERISEAVGDFIKYRLRFRRKRDTQVQDALAPNVGLQFLLDFKFFQVLFIFVLIEFLLLIIRPGVLNSPSFVCF